MIHKRQKRRVLVAHRLPVDAVHGRREEEVAHLPPAFEVDLAPLGTTIQLHVEAFDLVLVILGLDFILGDIDDGVILFNLHQHLFSVQRKLIVVRFADHCFLAVVEIVSVEVRFFVFLLEQLFVVLAHLIAGRAAQIKNAIVIQHSDVAIVSRRDFQTNDPVLDSVGINFHYDWLLWFFFRFFRAWTQLASLFLFLVFPRPCPPHRSSARAGLRFLSPA